MPDGDREAQLGYAVLGTALYDPVVAALRRLAHQDAALRPVGGCADDPDVTR
jgi:hypothetical protein